MTEARLPRIFHNTFPLDRRLEHDHAHLLLKSQNIAQVRDATQVVSGVRRGFVIRTTQDWQLICLKQVTRARCLRDCVANTIALAISIYRY